MFGFDGIRTPRDVVFTVLAVTALVFAIVAVFTTPLYPPEEWAEEILQHGGIAGMITAVLATKLCLMMRRTNLLYDQLQKRANVDPLTDVATRRAFFERLEADPNLSGVALMIDIDHFKAINDTHGHIAGDEVIRNVAARLKDQLRASDIVCRYGGEEFAVFLRDADSAEAERIAERMRTAVEAAEFGAADVCVSATISIGLATKSVDEDLSASIKNADDALYKAKEGGRNRLAAHLTNLARRASRSIPAT